MNRRAVITGIGTLTPAGRGTETLWEHIASGNTCLRPIDAQKFFDPTGYDCQVAGQVPSFNEPRILTEAILAQTDRCSQMALVAVLDALDAAKLPMDFRSTESPVKSERVALTVATIAAGWFYLERQMHNLWTKGLHAMERYGLTAGFLAGPQGHISICFGIEGRTRTFVSEQASGAHALIEAAKTIQRGDADVVVTGGTEAPITPLAWGAYNAASKLHPMSLSSDIVAYDQSSAYQDTPVLIGEGSTFLVLEEREHARQRGAPILAEICGWSRGTDPSLLASDKQSGRILARSIHTSLKQAQLQSTTIDAIFPGGSTFPEQKAAEQAALEDVFEQPLPIFSTKHILGHMQGAAVATDVAIAALALEQQDIGRDILDHPAANANGKGNIALNNILVLSNGLGGSHASLVISKSA